MLDAKNNLKETLKAAVKKVGFQMVRFEIEIPKQEKFGDLSTNLAMIIAKKEKKNPSEVAQKIIKNLQLDKNFTLPEIIGGFINFKFSNEYLANGITTVVDQESAFAAKNKGQGEKVLVEFVSANPTGQIHIGNARGGPIGLAIANLYDNFGYQVFREYYVNDLGIQISKFANTLLYYHQLEKNPKLEFPEDAYPGKFIKDIYQHLKKEYGNEFDEKAEEDLINFFAKEGIREMVNSIKTDLEYLGINYHTWSYESDILHSGKTDRIINILNKAGVTTDKEGALWFKNPEDPEMKDRETVLRKSDITESYTYFAQDIAYHLDKYERGFCKAIDVWGANHFGHISRLNAAMRAVGVPDNWLKIILYQNVRLKNGEEIVQMSKRRGNTVTMQDLKQAKIPADVFKYFVLMHDSNSMIDFDVKLAKDTSEKNPVYYLKYAYARLSGILRKSKRAGDSKNKILLKEPEEISLAKEILKLPEILEDTFLDFKIQRLPYYAYSLAGKFHTFYDKCHIIGEKKEVEESRLNLLLATKITLKKVLDVMAIEAPEKM